MPAHLQHVLTSVIKEALSDMRRPQLMPSAPQILSAEMSPYLLAAEADCRPDPGTSRHNPIGIRGCRLTRTSPRATSVHRTPSGNLPPQWCTPLNPAWPCRACLARERARSLAPSRRLSGIAVRQVSGSHLASRGRLHSCRSRAPCPD